MPDLPFPGAVASVTIGCVPLGKFSLMRMITKIDTMEAAVREISQAKNLWLDFYANQAIPIARR